MKTKMFYKLYKLIDLHSPSFNNYFPELNNKNEIEIYEKFIDLKLEKFLGELDHNLFKKKGEKYKITIIKFYIDKLISTSVLFTNCENILFKDLSEKGENELEDFLIKSHYIFNYIMITIQFSCRRENIDFISLCKNIDFDLTLFEEIAPLQNKTDIENKNLNLYPTIFSRTDNKSFLLFKTFIENHIIDFYIDYSFIFQQMKFNGYILDVKHLKFMNWLLEKEYINPKEHGIFLTEKSFRSLKKCAFGTRLNLYLKLQNSIIPTNSDLSE